jgi:hypothetical protein
MEPSSAGADAQRRGLGLSPLPGEVDCSRVNLLELRGVTKRYPGVAALDSVHLDVEPGSVHALIVVAGAFVLSGTRYGRYVYAVCGNEEAARCC